VDEEQREELTGALISPHPIPFRDGHGMGPKETVSMTLDMSRRGTLRGLAGAASLSAWGGLARAQESFPTTWTFGEVTVTRVIDTQGPFSTARAFPGAPLEEMDKAAAWLVPHFYDPATKNILFNYQSYVVKTPRHTVVMELGYGNDKQRGNPAMSMRKGPYLANLAAVGVRPDDVDYVLASHFHTDHVGWASQMIGGQWRPAFPNARYLIDKAELDGMTRGALGPDPGTKIAYEDSIKPVIDAGRAEMIAGGFYIGDGVQVVSTPGHTPGHQSLAIDSMGKRAILCGDILHNPIEVRFPEWEVLFDQDKEAGKAVRRKFCDQYADTDVTVFAAHFGGPTAGKIVSEKGGLRRFTTLAG
jgi:glyoxylase-like metal-dependent hydrolase (beta-lactamase superfamily II)